jgi:hypothetical protein
MYHQFNIQQFYVPLKHSVYVFCAYLRTNSCRFTAPSIWTQFSHSSCQSTNNRHTLKCTFPVDIRHSTRDECLKLSALNLNLGSAGNMRSTGFVCVYWRYVMICNVRVLCLCVYWRYIIICNLTVFCLCVYWRYVMVCNMRVLCLGVYWRYVMVCNVTVLCLCVYWQYVMICNMTVLCLCVYWLYVMICIVTVLCLCVYWRYVM